MSMMKKASNKIAFAKVGLYGEAGSGKTYTAAKIAIGMHQAVGSDKPVGMFDTEPAASYIIPLFEKAGIDFLVYDESRALVDLMRFMDEAEQTCSVVIIDSISHVWRDAQESYLAKINGKRKSQRLSPITSLEFHHWRPIKSAWAAFTDRFLASKLHVIVCGRAGKIYEYQDKDDGSGKKELISTGSRMATEKELGYEPSLLIEMIKHRDNGRIINRALIEKDRTDTMNGRIVDYPDFEKLRSHFDFLNIGGEHFSYSGRDSQDLYTEDGEDNWGHEKRQREIFCEEIQGLLLKHYPSQSAEHKAAKADAIETVFQTRSWKKVESMRSDEIRAGYRKMKSMLEAEQQPPQDGPTPPTVDEIKRQIEQATDTDALLTAIDLINTIQDQQSAKILLGTANAKLKELDLGEQVA